MYYNIALRHKTRAHDNRALLTFFQQLNRSSHHETIYYSRADGYKNEMARVSESASQERESSK